MAKINDIRYVNVENDVIYPDFLFTEFGCPSNVRRERLHAIEGDKEIWVEQRNKPMPGIEVQQRGSSEEVEDYVMDFDTPIDAWASDTHSGGPSNFHGNGGGDDNPRIPSMEGEQPGDFETAMQEFNESLSNA